MHGKIFSLTPVHMKIKEGRILRNKTLSKTLFFQRD